ncbi:MAG: single-stranded-DNA-specific exonuclease RecJ, partial [Oscillospiraceae bacterium]
MLYRNWKIGEPNAQSSERLGKEIKAGRLLSDVLVARGMETAPQAAGLLAESQPLPSPLLMQDMEKAVRRIHKAIENEESIVVFGDYDVDGITATALLYTYLESAGAEVFYKLPSRSDDGYGLSEALVDQIADNGISLIVTVDNGTSAFEAIERARQRGVEVVVTDHHLPQSSLPAVEALVNPCRQDDASPYNRLSGVGVAFMLACALEDCPPQELLPLFGDLVAIGTIADVMQLVDENRTLVRAGLAALQGTQRPGLMALI